MGRCESASEIEGSGEDLRRKKYLQCAGKDEMDEIRAAVFVT